MSDRVATHEELKEIYRNLVIKNKELEQALQVHESEIEKLKSKAIWAIKDCIHLNECLPHPSANDDFVYKRELKNLEELKE